MVLATDKLRSNTPYYKGSTWTSWAPEKRQNLNSELLLLQIIVLVKMCSIIVRCHSFFLMTGQLFKSLNP